MTVLGEDGPNTDYQIRQIRLQDTEDRRVVHAAVIVNQPMAHGCNEWPWHRGMSSLEVIFPRFRDLGV